MHLDAPIPAIRLGSESSILLRNIFTGKKLLDFFLCVLLAVVCPLHEAISAFSVLGAATLESGVGNVFLHNFFVTITALCCNQWPVLLTKLIV